MTWASVVVLTVCFGLLPEERASALAAAQETNPASAVPVSGAGTGVQEQNSRPNPAPDASAAPAPQVPPRPFLRLLATVLAGLVITAARLAHNFRRFLGLGVFTNAYAFVFLGLGAGICAVPVTSESTRLGMWLGPWVTDFLGVLVTIILPSIRLRSNVPSSAILDFEGTTTSNPFFAPIVNGICDRVLIRMKTAVIADSRRYTWEVIKLATRRILEEEATIGRLKPERRDATIQSIESFRISSDTHVDSGNKYTALIRLLGVCSYSRLRAGLAAAQTEVQA